MKRVRKGSQNLVSPIKLYFELQKSRASLNALWRCCFREDVPLCGRKISNCHLPVFKRFPKVLNINSHGIVLTFSGQKSARANYANNVVLNGWGLSSGMVVVIGLFRIDRAFLRR